MQTKNPSPAAGGKKVSGDLLALPLKLAAAAVLVFLPGNLLAAGCDEVVFTVAAQLPLGGRSLNVVTADFNGDATADVAATNDSGVVIYLGDGTGGFGPPSVFAASSLPRGLATADFNGDGRPDIVVANFADISVLINDGQGGFNAPIDLPAGDSPSAVATGDFNRDGRPDIVVANGQGDDVSVLLGNGAGGFSLAGNFPAGELPVSVAVGDFDNDGLLDLAVSTYASEEVRILRGDGQGGFVTVNSYQLGGNGSRIVAGDFNHDLNLDLAVGVYNIFPNNHMAVFLGQGDGSLAESSDILAPDPQGLATADFDGDGNLDLACTNYFVPSLVVSLGDGTGSFAPPRTTRLPGHPFPFGIAPADFNGDGKPDLAISNYGNGKVTILLNLPSAHIFAADPTASEADLSRGRFEVGRNGCTKERLTVRYTVGGTARPGIDYRALTGIITIPAGREFGRIPVVPLGNPLEQDSATVIVTLLPDADHVLGKDNTATVTIFNSQ